MVSSHLGNLFSAPMLLFSQAAVPLLLATPRMCAPPPVITMQDNGERFSQATKLRGEIEDPFSKVRLFLWPGLTAGAAIATYFGGTSALAELAGLRSASPDTLPNLAIDLAALAGTGFLWRREAVGQDKRLKRIAAGAALASLRVQPLSGPFGGKSVKLSALRSGRTDVDDPFEEASRRVVVCVAQEDALASCLEEARANSDAIADSDLLVVPLLVENGRIELPPPSLVVPTAAADGVDTAGSGAPAATAAAAVPASTAAAQHLALAQGVSAWQDVFGQEIEQALQQDETATARGLTLILKKNGRVGTRRLGLPGWPSLVGDVGARAGAGLDTRNI